MIAFRDELLDGQFLRTLGHATYGGAEAGECFAAAQRIDPRDRESWFRVWMTLGDRAIESAGDPAAYLRASNYYRNAYVLHLEAPLPAQARDAYAKHVDAFRRAGVAGPWLPDAYFASGGDGRRGVVVTVGGYDSTAEESWFWNGAAAVAHGYHAVMFDGPGQGAQLMRGTPFTPTWSLASILDAVAARPDVDPARIIVIGESFGGYLAPLSGGDPRIAALILDPPQASLADAMRARLPGPFRADFEHSRLLRFIIQHKARALTGGWALRRGALVHGVVSPWAYLLETQRYTGIDLAQLRCPTLVCDAEADDISANARAFYDRLTCPKAYERFTVADGAGAHCVSGNRALFHARAFGWLAR